MDTDPSIGASSPVNSSASCSSSPVSSFPPTAFGSGRAVPTSPSSSTPASPILHNPSSSRSVRFADNVPYSVEQLANYGFHVTSSSSALTVSPSPVPSSQLSSPRPSPETSPSIEPSSSPEPSLSRHCNLPTSPTSSAFASASDSPFFSPSLGSAPAISQCNKALAHRDQKNGGSFIEPSVCASKQKADGSTLPSSHSLASSRTAAPHVGSLPRPAHTFPVGCSSALLSSLARPRSCDVYVSAHGDGPALTRFSKWLRAELELQGIACFMADRVRFPDSHSRDNATNMINSCTFGVVIITRLTFSCAHSMEELNTFLQRKNLVPLFFDIAPSDCLARDIIERRGWVWEKDGGELWKQYNGDEKHWMEILGGLLKVDEWRLEAYTGNWRNCILKAVSMLGTRLGRRSVAERERLRKVRVDGEEFPFPRNPSFRGREMEMKVLEDTLFTRCKQASDRKDAENRGTRERRRHHVRNGNRISRSFHDSAKQGLVGSSHAASWSRHTGDDGTARRQTGSNRWYTRFGLTADDFHLQLDDGASPSDTDSEPMIHAEGVGPVSRINDVIPSSQFYQAENRHRRSRGRRGTQCADINQPLKGSIACIGGVSGVGKTEMALEFAYRFCQCYRMVLWVGGESRYLRQNYLKLSLFLGLEVGTESQVGGLEQGRYRTFDEQEMEALQRIQRELQRDVPYLLVIDNLESEQDWWDGRKIAELLPRAGEATHVIITTRLSSVMNLEAIELSHLSGSQALSLMKGKREFIPKELDVLKRIEEKLGRLTLGLSIVGSLLAELPIKPSELLEKLENPLQLKEWTGNDREEEILRNNPFLVKLFGVCFSFLDGTDGSKDLATRMAWVGGWFAPCPVPLSLLAIAASMFEYPRLLRSSKLLRNVNAALLFACAPTQSKKWEAEASSLLVKYGLARKCSQQGCIYFHEIVRLYARKRGGIQAAKAMVQGIGKKGSILLHPEQFWSACFLVLGVGNDLAVVELKVVELVSFIKRGVLPLAVHAFTSFSRCHTALELLRLCTNMLEGIERSFVSQAEGSGKFSCWGHNGADGQQIGEHIWQDVTILKALLLEARAGLLLKSGQFDAGEELCRSCINIRTAVLGREHPDTLTAQEILARLVRSRTSII